MFSLMMQKLLHKKWIVLCMLAGNILLIAVAVSQPMYRDSAFQQMLTDECRQYWQERGSWPTGFTAKYSVSRGYQAESPIEIEQAVEKVIAESGFSLKEYVAYYQAADLKGKAGLVRDNRQEKSMELAAMSNFWDHVDIVSGRLPAKELTEDGCIEVAASEAAMLRLDLLLDDTYEFSTLVDKKNGYAKVRVVGVYRIKDETELYWLGGGTNLSRQLFADSDLFLQTFTSGEKANAQGKIFFQWKVFWDYEKIQSSSLNDALKKMGAMISGGVLKGKAESRTFLDIVTGYNDKVNRVNATLTILQIPVLLLLCAFLYMISGQMLLMEQNEISLMKSRGAAGRQIVELYFMQSTFLALVSFFAALPIGALFCKFLGSSTAFLEFKGGRGLAVHPFIPGVFLYGSAAMLCAVAMTTLPVIRYSRVGIVHLKQGRAGKKKAWWKKLYLDIVCLGISLYGYSSYHRNSKTLLENVLEGKSLEPLLYVSSSLFILGCALLFCRVQPWLLKLLFRISKKRLEPAAYVSFLQTIRTGYKQEFIIIFMILTVAIGIFNATLSRTLIANTVSNTEYLMGAEVVFAERWPQKDGPLFGGPYIETPYEKYAAIPGVTKTSKVFCESVYLSPKDGIEKLQAQLMGIETKNFAEITTLQEGLLPYHYYEYLNVLASDRQGILVSENFRKDFGYKLGDSITVKDPDMNTFQGIIRGFFPYWPGYNSAGYHMTEEGDMVVDSNYLVVGNLEPMQESMSVLPYEIWMKTSDGGKGLSAWLADNPGVRVKSMETLEGNMEKKLGDPLIQGTNGILSMSFIIILLLCCVGYLIYWIMSIRSRELLFGILRAMGMRQKEITQMLVIEQIFSGVLAIIAGGVIGVFASRMFVPMIQKGLAATDQMLPLELVIQAGDMVKLFAVIGAMLCVCLFVLGRIVSKMNISNALKLGED